MTDAAAREMLRDTAKDGRACDGFFSQGVRPGSRKSTFLAEAGLLPATLSMDGIRALLGGPVMDESGTAGLDQSRNDRVCAMLKEVARDRMARGETLVIDTTMANADSLAHWAAEARRFLYSVAVLDMSPLPLETCLARNAGRTWDRRVRESVVRRLHARVSESAEAPLPDGVVRMDGTRPGAANLAVAHLSPRGIDLDGADRVVHVGDLHGCSHALDALLRSAGGVRDSDFWVFHPPRSPGLCRCASSPTGSAATTFPWMRRGKAGPRHP